jgi:hypothetical protein
MPKTKNEIFELYGGKVVIERTPTHRYYLSTENGEKLPKKKQLTGVTTFVDLLDKSRQLIIWATRIYTEKMHEMMEGGVNFTPDDVKAMLEVARCEHTKKKERAADIGSYVHKWAEEYAKTKDAKVAYDNVVNELGAPPEHIYKRIANSIKGLKEWLDDNVEILSSEGVVYSKKHGYCGQYDAIVMHNNGKYLVDFKTSKDIYSSHYYQTSAYLKGYEEENPKDKLDGVLIISIAKEDYYDKDGNLVKKAGEITTEFRSRADLVKDFVAFKSLIALRKREKENSKWVK